MFLSKPSPTLRKADNLLNKQKIVLKDDGAIFITMTRKIVRRTIATTNAGLKWQRAYAQYIEENFRPGNCTMVQHITPKKGSGKALVEPVKEDHRLSEENLSTKIVIYGTHSDLNANRHIIGNIIYELTRTNNSA